MSTEKEKTCIWCGKTFIPIHGNNQYCSAQCEDESRKDRQKKKRDPIKGFIPILINNHEILNALYEQGKTEVDQNEIEAYGLDISLCRYIKSTLEYPHSLALDFGTYFLIPDNAFYNFKIHKHGT